jgi:hypothetical protein
LKSHFIGNQTKLKLESLDAAHRPSSLIHCKTQFDIGQVLFRAVQQLRIRKLTTNGTNHTNKLRIILTISALIIDIIHIIFVFVREVGEVRGPKSELLGRSVRRAQFSKLAH